MYDLKYYGMVSAHYCECSGATGSPNCLSIPVTRRGLPVERLQSLDN